MDRRRRQGSACRARVWGDQAYRRDRMVIRKAIQADLKEMIISILGRLQAFSISITACAARFSSKDGHQTSWFRGGLTVRISSSPAVSHVRT
jgi:hypothetical protein